MTQTQVSRLLSCPQPYVSKCESGKRRVDFVEIQFLAKILNKPIECEQLFELNLKTVRLRALAVEEVATALSCGRVFRQRLGTAWRAAGSVRWRE